MFSFRDVIDYYGIHYETSKYNSSEVFCLCPFHDDSNIGSASFNEYEEVFHCFACGWGGNIFQFVAEIEKCSVRDAIKLVENDFDSTKSYDVDRTRERIERSVEKQKKTEVQQYRELSEKVVSRILIKLSEHPLDISKLSKWLHVCAWILHIDESVLNGKQKQVIVVYDEFLSDL